MRHSLSAVTETCSELGVRGSWGDVQCVVLKTKIAANIFEKAPIKILLVYT